MSELSFLAIPNIDGMRLWWYIQIFGIAIVFGICLFLLIYFFLKYRRAKSLSRQVALFDRHSQDLGKQLLIQKIQKSSGKDKLVLFIEYLERFITSDTYANLWELFHAQWFSAEEIQVFERAIYADKWLSQQWEQSIDTYFTL